MPRLIKPLFVARFRKIDKSGPFTMIHFDHDMTQYIIRAFGDVGVYAMSTTQENIILKDGAMHCYDYVIQTVTREMHTNPRILDHLKQDIRDWIDRTEAQGREVEQKQMLKFIARYKPALKFFGLTNELTIKDGVILTIWRKLRAMYAPHRWLQGDVKPQDCPIEATKKMLRTIQPKPMVGWVCESMRTKEALKAFSVSYLNDTLVLGKNPKAKAQVHNMFMAALKG